ncbi:hypothetical protein PMAYCL1PPCAC_03941, partial [Pristionchus mayeri]
VETRKLYCRKCEGHGQKVLIKNHSKVCLYKHCLCKTCSFVTLMRKKSNERQRSHYRKRSRDEDTATTAIRKASSEDKHIGQ